MGNRFGNAFEYKVIYVFEIRDEKHKGLVKIGDASISTDKGIEDLTPNSHELNHAARLRIKQYTNTAGIKPELLHTELAVKTVKDSDGKTVLKAFRDHDVHRVLRNSNIKNVKLQGSTSREWFRVDVETARKAIDAVKKSLGNLSGENITTFESIIFRPEQEDAIDRTVKQLSKGNRMLWNAKMRFGKTVCALEVARRMGFDHTIILTHRPVVNEGWYEDFNKVFHGEDCLYGSKANGNTIEELLSMQDMRFVYFASIQDLRGSEKVGGKWDKNSKVFDLDWDFVIVDEAHEGTTTVLGDDVIRHLVKEDSNHETKFLALSGTPFNILTNYGEEEVYTWDYIMEQDRKEKWPLEHFGDSNPYDELPELRIYTYDLGKLLENNFVALEDRAFNFHEFFRTFTGNISKDFEPIPNGAKVGDFVHSDDVWSFLNMMTMDDEDSCYPYSKEEYRELFKHSLWMLPGVKEAKALKAMMMKHPVFGSGAFNIVNVAGNGDSDEESSDALEKVQNAISNTLPDHYTITLSCGKLTTGVTIREWTAVFMLAGSFSTSAANYLQTIFRVQSPCNKDGMIKESGYVFDFAPDRTLKMVADAVSISHKAGKTSGDDVAALGRFLNYCPVISITGSEMHQYNTNNLLQQLKRAYADRVLRSGFDDTSLYNDELLKLTDVEIEKFKELSGIIGKTKAQKATNDITINDQGLTQEEYEALEKLKKKKKRELTPEEKARLEELKRMKKLRNDAISILRGISIRMPLLIYGADIPFDDDVTIDNFSDLIDEESWKEFMPEGVTKEKFLEFKKYYDPDIFIAAGRRIRNIAKSADELEPTERVKKIAGLFSYFKNPDKETVLTPWRVVNMHMSACLGGYNFWDEKYEDQLDNPRFVSQDETTNNVFGYEDTHILEINSKTGLYPLYVAYSTYRMKCKKFKDDELSLEKQYELWDETVRENIFVICKTPMAKSITNRTLIGYRDVKGINTKYSENLINTMKNEGAKFVKRTMRPSYWNKEGKEMHFNAIVGNPPYQEMDGGNKNSSRPVYHHFVSQAKRMKPDYISMIMPSRWFVGGKGLDSFREEMLKDNHMQSITDFADYRDIFPSVDLAGGVCYFKWNRDYEGLCTIENYNGGEVQSLNRSLDEFDILVRDNKSIPIVRKVLEANKGKNCLNKRVSTRKPFGMATDYKPKKEGIPCWFIQKYGKQFAAPNDVSDPNGILNKWKLLIPITPIAGQTDFTKPVGFYYDGNIFIAKPGECCTESFVVCGAFDTEKEVLSFKSYILTKTVRFLLLQSVISQHVTQKEYRFVPDLDKYEGEWTDDKLCKLWGITNEEFLYIDSRINNISGQGAKNNQ